MKKICCFAGHGDMRYSEKFYQELKATIDMVIREENITEFWVGNNGTFDQLVARAMRKVKKEHPHIKRYLVQRHFTREVMGNLGYYLRTYNAVCRTFIPAAMANEPHPTPHHECVINDSAVLICFVSHPGDDAAEMLAYAKTKDIRILNLAE